MKRILTFVFSVILAVSAFGQSPSTGSSNGHGYVDLGLSVKWATCNVGAASPSDFGSYFAWGETTSKKEFKWANYKFRISGNNWQNVTLRKYNNDKKRGAVDNKNRLEPADDAARANWGGKWRIPTRDEWVELRDRCTWTWTTIGGKKGYKVTSNVNGKSIFLPASEYSPASANDKGPIGRYWSSDCYVDPSGEYNGGHALDVYSYKISSSSHGTDYWLGRQFGFSVRPVTE